MTIPRLYLPQTLQEGGVFVLDADRRRYLDNVLRLRPGDAVTLFDGSGWDFHAVIERMGDREAAVRIVGRRAIPDAIPPVRITLAQALPKGAKMDGIVEKATEMGAIRIAPFHSARSVPRLDAAKAAARRARWEKIAVEAARRCRRPDVPAVEAIVSFDRMLALADPGLRIIFWEEGGQDIKGLLGETEGPTPRDCFLVVGPEGGFAPEEVAAARAAGFAVAGLGRRILRVETASLVILTIIQYERGVFAASGRPEGAGVAGCCEADAADGHIRGAEAGCGKGAGAAKWLEAAGAGGCTGGARETGRPEGAGAVGYRKGAGTEGAWEGAGVEECPEGAGAGGDAPKGAAS
ncbi:MAG: 16S rRNA (uracil(1498)-N(3))-methyltransferase [Pseudomonadota bacterium]|nr:16S rRNA (uracil(1498)-N(3))-methyltransferase [Pseudomonadota bacterium]